MSQVRASVSRRLAAARWLAVAAACAAAGCGAGSAGPGDAGPPPAAAEPSRPAFPTDPTPVFVDVAQDAGLLAMLYCGGAAKDHILESVGSGAAWIDYDEDGRVDAYLVNAWALDEEPSRVRVQGRNVLYRNRGDGTFEDVTEAAGVGDDGWGCGVCAGDYDGDGRVDLYVTNFGPNRLYRNRGDGTFEEVGERAGVADPGWGAGAAFFDADGDGDLDLYVANYIDATMAEVLAARRTTVFREKVKVMAGPFGLRGGRDRFFRNRGDGTFEDATDAAGMADVAESYGLGVVASDLDLDGDVDVYVANDSNPNFLYRNEGDGTFTEIGSWSGAGLSGEAVAQAGMGVDAADLDGDGLPEIFVTNFTSDSATLYRNMGSLLFQDVSAAHELKRITYHVLKWGCGFFDADCDGDLDVAFVNGHIYPQVDAEPGLGESYAQLPTLLRNEGGRLVDVSREAGPGFHTARSMRGLAFADYDRDGDLDLLITAIDAPPLLLRNDTPRAGHWIELKLVDRAGAPALNARAAVTACGRVQFRELRSGSSYVSQNELTLHFGLGDAERVERIEVTWPDGRGQRLEDQPVDRRIEIRDDGPGDAARETRAGSGG
jgi:hypothetical protein